MAYEMKPGQLQVTTGKFSGNKPVLSVKVKTQAAEHDIVLWSRDLGWGKSISGNLGGIKGLYCEFLRFTVMAVKHYMKEKPTQTQTNSSQAQNTNQAPPRQGGVL